MSIITQVMLYVISKTNLVRNLVLSMVGAMVGAGVLADSDVEQVAAGLVILITGVVSWWVEHAKTVHVTEVQRQLQQDGDPVKADGYLGPKTKLAINRRMRGHV